MVSEWGGSAVAPGRVAASPDASVAPPHHGAPTPDEGLAGRRPPEDRLFRWSIAVAVTPILVAAVRGSVRGWRPVSDNALVAVRSYDVMTSHPPLLGMWSSASVWSHVPFNLPGPIEFVLLAVPVRVLGPSAGLAIGIALVHIAAIVALAWLVRRRGGPLLGTLAMVFVVSLSWSMGSEYLYDPWPINSAPFVFLLLLVAAWAVADGDVVGLPVLAVAGTYLVQTHLSYVILAPALGLAALTGLAVALRRRRRVGGDEWPAVRRRAVWWLVASLAITLVLWVPPLVQQLTNSPGNLTSLVRASRAKPPIAPDLAGALKVVGSTVALPPWWLPPSYESPEFDLAGDGRSLVWCVAGLAVMIAAGAALARKARQRGDHASLTVLLVAGTALAAGVLTAYKSPSPVGFHPNYLRWLWGVSLFCWFALAVVATRVLSVALPGHASWSRWSTAWLFVLALVGAGLALPTADHGVFPQAGASVIDDVMDRVRPQLRGRTPVLYRVTGSEGLLALVAPPALIDLQQHGIPFVVDNVGLEHQLGGDRRWNGHNARATLVFDTSKSPPSGFRRLASYNGRPEREQAELASLTRQVRAWLARNRDPQLTERGRRAVAKNRLLRAAWSIVRSLRGDPDALMGSSAFRGVVGYDTGGPDRRPSIVNTAPLDESKVVRWAELTRRSDLNRVAVDLGPVPPPPAQ